MADVDGEPDQETDIYFSIETPATLEIPRIRGSRFVADANFATSAEEAQSHMQDIRKKWGGATHHCFAYRVGVEESTFRVNDDGEPGGTAGIPILRQIDGRQLTNVVVAVTRYFGGTKLGAGGLIRAYGEAASTVLEAAGRVEKVIRIPVKLVFQYGDTAPAMHIISLFGASIINSNYSDSTELQVAIRKSQLSDFSDAFRDALGGRGKVVR